MESPLRTSLRRLRRPLATPDMRRIWMAQALSDLGDWAATVALAVLVLERTGSPALTTAVFAASVSPGIGFGPLLASIGDRLPRRTVMVASDLLRAAITLAMVIPSPTAVLFVLVFVNGLASVPFRAARGALVPELVPADEYEDAQLLRNVTEQTAVLAGYLFGGGLVTVIGARGALGVNAATFLGSALLLARMRAGRRAAEATEQDEHGTGVLATIRWIRGRPQLVAVAVAGCTFAACAMVIESSTAVYATEELGRSGATAGLLAAAIPAGTICAAFTRFGLGDATLLRRMGVIGALGSAAAGALIVASVPLPTILLCFFAIGCVYATGIPVYTVFGARVPSTLRSTSFGVPHGAFTLAEVLGAVLGGIGAQLTSVRWSCGVACGLGVLIGVASLLVSRPLAAVEGSSVDLEEA